MSTPILTVKREYTYTFNQYLTDHLMIISTDGLGGPNHEFTYELAEGLTHFYKTEEGVEYTGEVH